MADNGGDDDGAAEQSPARGALTEDEEHPNGIQQRFGVTDNAGI